VEPVVTTGTEVGETAVVVKFEPTEALAAEKNGTNLP